MSVVRRNDGVHLYNHPFDLKIVAPDSVDALLDGYNNPRPLPDCATLSAEDRTLYSDLLSHFILLPNDAAGSLKTGLTRSATDVVGNRLPVTALSALPPNASCVLGAPFDLGSLRGGASQGVRAIRSAFRGYQDALTSASEASQSQFIYDFELRRRHSIADLSVLDLGDIYHDPMNGADGFSQKVEFVVRRILKNSAFPILLGGDHTITLFALRALASQVGGFGLFHFDAHHDLYLNSYRQRTTLNHGNFLAEAMSWSELRQVVNVGGRGVEHLNHHSLSRRDDRLSWVTPLQLRKRPISELLAHVRTDIPWYFSFDIDALDPLVASDTGSPVPGGLGYLDAVECTDYILSTINVVGADFVEVRPGDGVRLSGSGARVAARLLLQVLLRKSKYDEV